MSSNNLFVKGIYQYRAQSRDDMVSLMMISKITSLVVILLILLLLYNRIPNLAEATSWETYQSAGHQAIVEKRVDDAEQLLLAAAKQIERINPEDPRLASTLNDLGVLYGMQKRDIEAESLFHRSLAINEKAFGRQHLAIILTSQNLGVIYAVQDKFLEAHQVSRESLAISLELFGVGHPRTGSTCRTLAIVYELQGAYDEAEQFAEHSVTIFENTMGEGHPETLESLEVLIRLMWMTYREREAQQLEARLNTLRSRPY